MKRHFTVLFCIAAASGCSAQVEAPVESTGEVGQELVGGAQQFAWGGRYQIDDCGTNSVNNPLTGGLNCPSGFTPLNGGRQTDPESNCGGSDYFCAKSGMGSFDSRMWGMFQVDDCGVNTIGNPDNSNLLSCPSGFTTVRVGRVKTPESQCGAWQYACRGSFPSSWRWYGGEYQVGDVSTGTKVNPLTGQASCPFGYTPKRYGRILSAEPWDAKVGVNQYYCSST